MTPEYFPGKLKSYFILLGKESYFKKQKPCPSARHCFCFLLNQNRYFPMEYTAYIWAVVLSAWPSMAWTARMSAPLRMRWAAKECRRV